MKQGIHATLRHWIPGLSGPWRDLITGLWLVVMLLLAAYGFLEPRAEFQYLAM
ncbi:hypothetical protein [Magnetospira thiophila]